MRYTIEASHRRWGDALADANKRSAAAKRRGRKVTLKVKGVPLPGRDQDGNQVWVWQVRKEATR